jgi:cupin superfamily acireductone dioxygenase involved in methionine salvage
VIVKLNVTRVEFLMRSPGQDSVDLVNPQTRSPPPRHLLANFDHFHYILCLIGEFS